MAWIDQSLLSHSLTERRWLLSRPHVALLHTVMCRFCVWVVLSLRNEWPKVANAKLPVERVLGSGEMPDYLPLPPLASASFFASSQVLLSRVGHESELAQLWPECGGCAGVPLREASSDVTYSFISYQDQCRTVVAPDLSVLPIDCALGVKEFFARLVKRF